MMCAFLSTLATNTSPSLCSMQIHFYSVCKIKFHIHLRCFASSAKNEQMQIQSLCELVFEQIQNVRNEREKKHSRQLKANNFVLVYICFGSDSSSLLLLLLLSLPFFSLNSLTRRDSNNSSFLLSSLNCECTNEAFIETLSIALGIQCVLSHVHSQTYGLHTRNAYYIEYHFRF